MQDGKDIEDVWDDLLEEAPMSDGKTGTQVGIRALFEREASGEYIALKSHDLYEAFSAREPTDVYHKPVTEVDLVPQDVEDFFEDLLDEMLSASIESDSAPSLQITQPTQKMVHNRIARSHVRRQLLLWLLGIEGLEGTHRVSFSLGENLSDLEALVIDGQLCVMMRSGDKPVVDAQFEQEHEALYKRIRQTLRSKPDVIKGSWEHVTIEAHFELDELERRALMELSLRVLTSSARQQLERILPLKSAPVRLDQVDVLRFRPLDFFLLADDHLQGEVHDLPSRTGATLAGEHEARGWLMHHTQPLHPFDALITRSPCTPHTIRSASRATLFGNASRQLIEALGFGAHHSCLFAITRDIFSLALTDEHFISAHDYALSSLPQVVGEVVASLDEYPSRVSPEEIANVSSISSDDALGGLSVDMYTCEAIVTCAPRSEQESWQIWVSEEVSARAHVFVAGQKRARAVCAALEQFKIVSPEHDRVDAVYVCDQDYTCVVLATPSGGHVLWLCRASTNIGLLHAQARANLRAWLDRVEPDSTHTSSAKKAV